MAQNHNCPTTSVDCLPTYGNNSDKLTSYGECHGCRHYSVTDSVQQSNKEILSYILQHCGEKLNCDLNGDDSSYSSDNNDIAMEFCDELECFIAGHVDNNAESSIGVTEFETLTHHLLNDREHYMITSDEDEHVLNTFIYSESTVHNLSLIHISEPTRPY